MQGREHRQRLLQELIKRQGEKCGICKKYLPFHDANFDHIVPRSKGGSDRQFNLRATHFECNNKRGSDAEDSLDYHNRISIHRKMGLLIE